MACRKDSERSYYGSLRLSFCTRIQSYLHSSVLPHLMVVLAALPHSVRSTLVHTCTAVIAAVADSLPLCILRALLLFFQAMPKPTTF